MSTDAHPLALTLRLNAKPAERAMQRLSALAEAGEISAELIELLANGLQAFFQCRTVHGYDFTAAGAHHVLVVLEPTERLRVLVPALRAGDGDLGAVDEVHASSPCAVDAGMKGDGAVAAGHPRQSSGAASDVDTGEVPV